jgi:hypothetical protein
VATLGWCFWRRCLGQDWGPWGRLDLPGAMESVPSQLSLIGHGDWLPPFPCISFPQSARLSTLRTVTEAVGWVQVGQY